MRTDAHANPFFLPRLWRMMPLLLLIVLSANGPVFGQKTPAGAVNGVGQPAQPQQPAEVPTRIDLPSQPQPAAAASSAAPSPATPATQLQLPDLTKRENFSSALQIIMLLTVLSLAPAILIMMTSFTRIVIVLSLLRQALGTQQLPPNQVMIGLAMFMTFLVMGPTWQRVNNEALRPYLDGKIQQKEAYDLAIVPVREFMIAQIQRSGNDEDVRLFASFAKEPEPATWHDVSTTTLIPSFMLSELKTAFLMGFKIYLPFLVIDMVISIVLISMGMMMLPPALIALPFKLLLFVLVDGWHLITLSLMSSFSTS
jgi:flagellar biosynthetic protein FliP